MAVTIVCCYLGLIIVHFVNFHYMHTYTLSTDAFADDFLVRSKFLDRIQMLFQCCGVHNYTEWGSGIPCSCCIDIKPGCQQNISRIYHKSCSSDIVNYVNNEVRYQTFNAQVESFFAGVFLSFFGVFCLYWSGKAYCERFQCFKTVGRQADDQEVLIGDNNLEDPNNEDNGYDNMQINNTPAEETNEEELLDNINGNNGVDANENPQLVEL